MAANGKSALVTGAGKNIGRACVLGLAEDGFNVAINGSSDRAACDKVAKEAEKFGVKAIVIMGDVGKAAECKRIADAAIEAFGSRAPACPAWWRRAGAASSTSPA
jgi:3-oxoacyl-[acyl-carrier protein] reductase